MSDLIDRQQAIMDAESWVAVDEYEKHLQKNVVEWLKELPSAELGTNLAEVGTDVPDINVGELISRQQAIDICDHAIDLLKGQFGAGALDAIRESIAELPPAQPEPIRINLNEPIKVKLTDWGKEIYYHQYDRANQIAGREICKPKFPKEDENGYTEFQLWRFMELYGEHMGMTLPNVIEPLEIVYERRTG